jgi:hypothetical protein
MKLVRTPNPGWNGEVGKVRFVDGEAKVADDATEMAYFRSAGYEISDFTDAVEAARDSDDPETADDLEELDEQSGTEEADPQIVRDVDDDGVEEVLPRRNASAEEWRRFGIEHGLSQDEVDGMSRDDLVEHFTKEDDQ